MTERYAKFKKLMLSITSNLEDVKMDFLDADYRAAYAKVHALQQSILVGLGEVEENDDET